MKILLILLLILSATNISLDPKVKITPRIINLIPYSPYIIDRFSQRLEWASTAYMEEASKRDFYVSNPLLKYRFSMRYDGPNQKRIVGYCFKKKSTIFLTSDFHESLFFHELGHCDLNYSHISDVDVLLKGHSHKIMSWFFKEESYTFKKKEVLDHFFRKTNHTLDNTFAGTINHLKMISQYSIYLRNKKTQKLMELALKVKKVKNDKI